MKVYIVTKQPFPNGMAGTNRIKCYAKAVLLQGVECVVLNYTRTEVYGKKPRNTEGEGVSDGIPFRYVGGTPLRSANVFLRKLNDLSDKWRLRSFLKKHLLPGDVVLGYAGGDVAYITSLVKLIHAKNAFFVKDLCELPYGTGKETPSAVRGRKRTLERQFPLCDGIISISDALQNLAKQYVSNNCRLMKIPIMVDYGRYAMEDCSAEAEIPYIFHSGTLYEQKDGILGMIEAFGMVLQKTGTPLRFVLTGKMEDSPHSGEIANLIKKYDLVGKIKFTGYLPDSELKQYLSRASLVVINKYRTQQNRYCFSTKLGEYLAAEKPVIATDVGEAVNWLENGKTARIVEPGDVAQLADAIAEMMNNPQSRHAIAKAGKELCRTSFDYRTYGKKLVLYFEKLEMKR